MTKPVQRKRHKNKTIVTCENCINCMYVGHGDMYCNMYMYCDERKNFELVYEKFCPTKEYMWCKGKKFEER